MFNNIPELNQWHELKIKFAERIRTDEPIVFVHEEIQF